MQTTNTGPTSQYSGDIRGLSAHRMQTTNTATELVTWTLVTPDGAQRITLTHTWGDVQAQSTILRPRTDGRPALPLRTELDPTIAAILYDLLEHAADPITTDAHRDFIEAQQAMHDREFRP